MTEKQVHQINLHYDKDPRDRQMRDWGWRPNRFGDSWAMPADEYIDRLRIDQGIERTERLSTLLDQPLHSPHKLYDALDEVLKDCVRIDREIKHDRD